MHHSANLTKHTAEQLHINYNFCIILENIHYKTEQLPIHYQYQMHCSGNL